MVEAATKLFARRGIHAVTTRELNEAAGQRNASALHYHFGSREGLLREILTRHQSQIDAARGALLASGQYQGLEGSVRALVVPLSEALRTRDGRQYLRIVAQAMAELGVRDELTTEPPNARAAVTAIVAALDDIPDRTRAVRVAHAVLFITDALAHRARIIDARRPVALEHDAFVEDLVRTIVGALSVPAAPDGAKP
jgi:AcrR family transcriptional regulator